MMDFFSGLLDTVVWSSFRFVLLMMLPVWYAAASKKDLHHAHVRLSKFSSSPITSTMRAAVNLMRQRIIASLTTFPVGCEGWYQIAAITAATTVLAGVGAWATGFVDPIDDFSPPSITSMWRPLSAFVFPGLAEEIIWRAALLPTPAAATTICTIFQHATTSTKNKAGAGAVTTTISPSTMVLYKIAIVVLIVHVCAHPACPAALYPRGSEVFSDPRFFFLATIVLGGTTLSYIVSGGSVWAAVLTHAVPVALWRDFFGGEEALRYVGLGTK